MIARKRLNELEGRTAECRSLISDLKEYIKEAEMKIEELQSSIEGWKESIGIIENLVREYEYEKELLEEEAYNERQREIVEENIAWRMMKL